MRHWLVVLAASGVVTVMNAGAARAADKPVIGPAPAWVKPIALPPASRQD